MMARSIALALAALLASCGTSDPHTTPVDAPVGPDAPMCTGAVYDPCTDPTQCMSGMCHDYKGSMLSVCTTSCSASSPCPTQDGVTIACNMMGNCKPPMANACAR
jgi:hypothetical protein